MINNTADEEKSVKNIFETKNSKETSEEVPVLAIALILIVLIPFTGVIYYIDMLFGETIKNILSQIVGWGCLGCLMYSTTKKLHLKTEGSKNLKGNDIVIIVCLMLHILVMAFLIFNNFIFPERKIEKISRAFRKNPMGIFFASILFVNAQGILECDKDYRVLVILLDTILEMRFVEIFNYKENKAHGIWIKFFVSIIVGAVLWIIEDYVIYSFNISKRSARKIRNFMKIILALGYTIGGYYMMSKIFYAARTNIEGQNQIKIV
ncbi:hypothetical protein KMI_17g19920 [Encephalitozoon hellem]|nr:hypothetical protein KMI_17g19920 [Encephalitozoon hellem]